MSLKGDRDQGRVPYDGRKENVAPSFKKGQKNNLGKCSLVGVSDLWGTFSRQKLRQEILSGNKEKFFHPWDNQPVEQPKEVVWSLSLKVFKT